MKSRYSMDNLGNYVKIRTGKLDANANDQNGIYPFFTCAVEPLRINSYSFDCECILVAGNGDLNVKYYDGKFEAYQRTYVIESRDKFKLDVRYLFHFMSEYVQKLREMSIGGVIKYIKLNYLTDAEIPLPPLNEQRRIAAILDKAGTIRRKRQESIRLTDEFLRSTFLEMFGDPATNSRGLKSTRLNDVCRKITDGEHLNPIFVEVGFPIVMANNVREEGIVFQGVKYVSEQDYKKFIKKCKPEKDDILIVSRGATIGRCTAVDTDTPFCLMGSTILLKIDHNVVTSSFMKYLLQHPAYQAKLYKTSSASAQQAIYLSHIKELSLPIPSINRQHQFSTVVEARNKALGHYKQSLSEVDILFNSLNQRAFRGELS